MRVPRDEPRTVAEPNVRKELDGLLKDIVLNERRGKHEETREALKALKHFLSGEKYDEFLLEMEKSLAQEGMKKQPMLEGHAGRVKGDKPARGPRLINL